MALYHDTIPVPQRVVTALTSGPVTAARVQALGPGEIRIQVTATATAPLASEFGGAIHAGGGYPSGIDTDRTLAERFAGRIATGATGYLWGYTGDRDMWASVSHA